MNKINATARLAAGAVVKAATNYRSLMNRLGHALMGTAAKASLDADGVLYRVKGDDTCMAIDLAAAKALVAALTKNQGAVVYVKAVSGKSVRMFIRGPDDAPEHDAHSDMMQNYD